MNYKLFDDFITLQAILKELGIIQSGGAIKAFLQEKEVFRFDFRYPSFEISNNTPI